MKLIDQYVYDVTRRLPERQRYDVAKELTAEIHDMADDRANGKKPKKADVYDVLVELGSPSSLADKYRDRPRYLIGPDYYEPYISLLKTLHLIVLPILLFVVWMGEAMTANHTPFTLVGTLLGLALQTSVNIFFWVTISFWFVQKVADGQPHDHSWTPDELPDMPSTRVISRNESYVAIAWSVLGISAVSAQIPAINEAIRPDNMPLFFSETMWPGWTLGMLALVFAGLAVEVAKLAVGGWTRLTVTLIMVVNLITIGFFACLLLFVPQIINPDFIELISKTLYSPDVVGATNATVIGFIGVIVAICLWEIGDAIVKYKKGAKDD